MFALSSRKLGTCMQAVLEIAIDMLPGGSWVKLALVEAKERVETAATIKWVPAAGRVGSDSLGRWFWPCRWTF